MNVNRHVSAATRYLIGLAGCAAVCVGALFSARHRETLNEVTVRMGWRKRPRQAAPETQRSIPEITVAELLGHELDVRLIEPDSVDGNVSGFELVVIAALARMVGHTACFEIGTFDGRTTLNLAANTPEECRVYTLDLPASGLESTNLRIAPADAKYVDKPASGARFQHMPYLGRITQFLSDSATFDASPCEGQMDLVFVDGAHSYEYVRSDTDLALRLLKPDAGLIVWHDYGSRWWPEVTRALDVLCHEDPKLGGMRHIRGTTLVVWEKGGRGGGGSRRSEV